MTTREQHLTDLAAHTRALLTETRENTPHTRDPGHGADGTRRPTPEHHTHRTRGHGLLAQLVEALTPGNTPTDDGTRRQRPRSRPPSNPQTADTLTHITTTAHDLRARLAPDGARHTGPGVGATLRDIVRYAHTSDIDGAADAARTTRDMVRRARAALGYDPPRRTLGDPCPYCEGPLHVLADLSGPVWCGTVTCRDDTGRRHTWPRETWIHLLERMGAQ